MIIVVLDLDFDNWLFCIKSYINTKGLVMNKFKYDETRDNTMNVFLLFHLSYTPFYILDSHWSFNFLLISCIWSNLFKLEIYFTLIFLGVVNLKLRFKINEVSQSFYWIDCFLSVLLFEFIFFVEIFSFFNFRFLSQKVYCWSINRIFNVNKRRNQQSTSL